MSRVQTDQSDTRPLLDAAAFISDGTVVANDDVSVTVTGSGNAIYGGHRSNFNVYGDSTTLTIGSFSTGLVIGTSDTAVEGDGSRLSLVNTGAGANRVYENGTAAMAGVVDLVAGGSSTVTFNSINDAAELRGGGGLAVNGSNGAISFASDVHNVRQRHQHPTRSARKG